MLELTRPTYERFVAASKDPQPFHQRALSSILSEISDGPFWKARAENRMSLEDLPITQFEDYADALSAAAGSRVSPLTGKPIIWWGLSSGTTGGAAKKAFPFTEAKFREAIEWRSLMIHLILRRASNQAPASIAWLSNMNPVPVAVSGLPSGFLTAFLRIFDPGTQATSCMPPEAYSSEETHRTWAALYALSQDVVSINAVTALPIASFLGSLGERFDQYKHFLRSGNLFPKELPELAFSAGRFDQLTAIFRGGSRPNLKEIWPSLSSLYCWKSSSSEALLGALNPFLQDGIEVVQNAYGSTEGFFALPSPDGEEAAGPIAPLSSVIEFLDLDDELSPGNLKLGWDLETGKSYEVFITNKLGLVRYRIQDIVKCTGRFNALPLIQFVQKSGANIALGTLQVTYQDLTTAILEAGLHVQGRWVFSPRPDSRGIVLTHDLEIRDVADAMIRIDNVLRENKRYYHALRAQGEMEPLRATLVSSDDALWATFPPATHGQLKPVIVIPTPIS